MKTQRDPIRRCAGVGALLLLLAAAWWSGGSFAAFGRALERAPAVAAETAAPMLAGWLAASAEAARSDGVLPAPIEIHQALDGFFDPALLARVRYRIAGGGLTSVQGLAFLHPRTRAIALDGVIVFRDHENAGKPRYWVHEITHLEQIRRWGLQGFASRYLRDPAAVEAEAWALTDRYVAWSLRRELDAAADLRLPGGNGG